MQQTDLESLWTSALRASQEGRSDEAVRQWRECIARQPHFPRAHYLLGAEYAQLGRYGDAVVHFSLAVEQEPDFAPVRLQLGLLWLTLKSVAQSKQVLQPLVTLPDSQPYAHFAAGLIALGEDQLALAHERISAGLQRPLDNEPLRQDMQRLLRAIDDAHSNEAAASATESARLGLALSAYTGTRH